MNNILKNVAHQVNRISQLRSKPKPRTATKFRKRTHLPKVERVDGARFFSMERVYGEDGVAALISPDGLDKRSIAHLSFDKFSQRREYVLNLSDVFDPRTHCHEGVFMLRKTPITSAVDNLQDRIRYALNQAVPGGESEKLLQDYQLWILGTGEGRHAYELLIIARHDSMVGEGRTSALYGRLVKDAELGPFIHDWIQSSPITWRSQEGLRQLDYAVPQTIWWDPKTYFVIPDAEKAYAIWLGILPPGDQEEMYKDLLDTADYVVVHAEQHAEDREGGEIWANVMAVVTRQWKDKTPGGEDPEPPDFSDAIRTLGNKLGLVWATYDRLYDAMKCMAPCSFSPPVRPEYLPEPGRVFGTPSPKKPPYLTARLTPFSQEDGNLGLGLIKGKTPAILEKFGDNSPNLGGFGPSGEAGKTAILGYLAFVASVLANHKARIKTNAIPYLMWLSLGKVVDSPIEKAIARWPGHMVKDLSHLEDANIILSRQRKAGETITKKQVQDLQEELHAQATQDARAYADWLLAEGLDHGRPMHLPHTFTYGLEPVKTITRVWLDAFLERWAGNWAQFFHLWGTRCVLVCDDIHALEVGPDPNLGELPADLARGLGSRIDGLLTQGKNNGIHTWVFTQAHGDMAMFGSAYNHINTAVTLSKNDQGIRVGMITKPHPQAEKPLETDTVIFDEVEYILSEYALGLTGTPPER